MAYIGGIFILMFVDPDVVILALLVAAGVILALAISGFRSANRQNQKRLGDGAKRIGLEVDSGDLESRDMSGKIKDFEVKVDRSLNTETVKIRYPRALGVGLCLTHQSYYDRAARWLGNQDIEVGDEEFDRRVVVQGDARQVVSFLSEERRTKILELFDLDDAFMIMDRGITLKSLGRPLPSSELSEYLKKMVEVATVLTRKEKTQPRRSQNKRKPTPPPPLPQKKETPEANPAKKEVSVKDEFYEEYGGVLKDALSLARQQAATGKISGRNAKLLVSAALVANRDFEGAASILAKIKESGPVTVQPVQDESTLTNLLPQSTRAAAVEQAETINHAEEPPSDKVATAIEERADDKSETKIEEREPVAEEHQAEQIEEEKETVQSSEETLEEQEEEREADESEAAPESESEAVVSREVEVTSASDLEDETESTTEEEQDSIPVGPEATPLCKELFSSLSSRAAAKKFEEEYKDAEVCWSGTLQRIETFITDRIFDQDTELVAVFSLVDPDDKYSTRLADALISFPKEAEADLRPNVGRMTEFTGMLFQMQPFMRNLYLKEGCLAVEVA